jgi:hypothetical protein
MASKLQSSACLRLTIKPRQLNVGFIIFAHNHLFLHVISGSLIKAGSRTIQDAIHKLIISVWNKEELPDEWKESIIVPTCL